MKKIRPFVDKNMCIDEYADQSGIILFGRMLIGIEIGHSRLGLILFNQAAGLWLDGEADQYPFFDSLLSRWFLAYILRVLLLIATIYLFLQI